MYFVQVMVVHVMMETVNVTMDGVGMIVAHLNVLLAAMRKEAPVRALESVRASPLGRGPTVTRSCAACATVKEDTVKMAHAPVMMTTPEIAVTQVRTSNKLCPQTLQYMMIKAQCLYYSTCTSINYTAIV